jgi:SP family general alpha glucoside:H+ symporter-like MFS transporter
LQWVWPLPLLVVAYFAPDSPWSCVRRDKIEEAKISLRRLRQETATSEMEIEATLALIVHTTQLERAEVSGASYLECFKGTNRRRTEINMATWAIQILSGNAILGFAVTL